jgi:hypothetical protein
LKSWVAGESDAEEVAQTIGANYRRMVEAYEAAAATAEVKR